MEAQIVLSSSQYVTLFKNPAPLITVSNQTFPFCILLDMMLEKEANSIQFWPLVYKEWIRYKQLSRLILFDKLYKDFSCRQGNIPFGKYPEFVIKQFLVIFMALLSVATDNRTLYNYIKSQSPHRYQKKKKKPNFYITQRKFLV